MKYSQATTQREFEYIAGLFNPRNTQFMLTKTTDWHALQTQAENGRLHFILRKRNVPIGWFNLRCTRHEWWFGMIIDAPFAGKGLGKQALIFIEQEARKQNAVHLWLRTMKDNVHAFNLFLHGGYDPLHIDKDGCWVMQKKFI